jgi:hypothetical protein
MTYEQEREQATRQVAAHARAARDAEWPGKRVQHEESIRWLCAKYDLPSPIAPPPERPPSYEVIKAEIAKLGFADALAMFWDAHGRQGEAPHDYAKAFSNMRRQAVVALGTHQRDHIWLPKCVECSAPMQFERVVPGVPKGPGVEWFSNQRYSK